MNCPTGDEIHIELRDPEEIKEKFYGEPVAPGDVKCYNPSFDVTDHSLITAIVTEKGICYPRIRRALRSCSELPPERQSEPHDICRRSERRECTLLIEAQQEERDNGRADLPCRKCDPDAGRPHEPGEDEADRDSDHELAKQGDDKRPPSVSRASKVPE